MQLLWKFQINRPSGFWDTRWPLKPEIDLWRRRTWRSGHQKVYRHGSMPDLTTVKISWWYVEYFLSYRSEIKRTTNRQTDEKSCSAWYLPKLNWNWLTPLIDLVHLTDTNAMQLLWKFQINRLSGFWDMRWPLKPEIDLWWPWPLSEVGRVGCSVTSKPSSITLHSQMGP